MQLLGFDIESGNAVTLMDTERRSSLYVLGKPGTGKTTLLVNSILSDIDQCSLGFFLDPHGEAVDQVISALSEYLSYWRIQLLNPTDNDYAFGINPLYCPDITSFSARQETFNKTYTVFKRLWEKDTHWGVWLRLILENMLPLLIETEYTLAEANLFLRNKKFRSHVLQQIKYNARLVPFWQSEFKEEQAQAAITRISSLLSRDYVAHILGQKKRQLILLIL
jgi:hypothetical protein